MDEDNLSGNKRIELIPSVAENFAQRRIVLNVGGQRHETYLGTIKNFPDTRLFWVVENVAKAIDYSSDKIELFFDRHPGIFAQVLNYYRTGKLHCPNDVCGPLFEEELAYWGIDEKDMEPCCWTSYTQHREAEQNLKSFNPPPEGDSEQEYEIEEELPNSQHSRKLSWQNHWQHLQPRMWAILEEPRSSKAAKAFSIVSILLILLSVASSCAQTLPRFREYRRSSNLSSSISNTDTTSKTLFDVIEYFCGIWFTLELLLRIIFCPQRLIFFTRLTNWIDILSVMPFYLRFVDLELADAFLTIRLLRLYRFFRLLYGLQVLMHTLKASSYELGLLLLILLIPVVLFSSMMFYVENSQDKNTIFSSIPASFWWSLITMTTVGYGDMVPKTWPGQIIGCACAVCGVLMVALPISIIGSNFNLYYAHAQARLKLPRKKARLHIDAMATALSSRHNFRRRAVRRRSPENNSVNIVRNSGTTKLQENSVLKRESNDSRSLSSSACWTESFTSAKYSPSTSRRKISWEKPERKFSRREKTIQTLEHLIEKDELSDSHGPEFNTIDSGRKSLGISKIKDRLSFLSAQNQQPRHLRSSSVPSNSQRSPFKLKVAVKSKSESESLCKMCLLPKERSLSSEIRNQVESSEEAAAELCKCRSTKKRKTRKESSTSRVSQLSNFTVLIHDEVSDETHGVDENRIISTDDITPSLKAGHFSPPVQVQVHFSRNNSISFDDFNGDSSDCSENSVATGYASHDPHPCLVSQGAQDETRQARNNENLVNAASNAAEKPKRENSSFDTSSRVPLFVIQMPSLTNQASENETSI